MAYLCRDLESRLQTELPSVKMCFLGQLKKLCPDYKVDEANQAIVSDIFNWCIRNKNGNLNPNRGLWIYGGVGTGKSTLMKAILAFIKENWRRDCDDAINPRWENMAMLCGEYAKDGFSVFDSIPMGLDEVGTEVSPTNHVGNKINVFAQIISTLYDLPGALPTIVTTNLTISNVLEKYGPRTVDRIGQMFNLVEMLGASRRESNGIWDKWKAEQSTQPKTTNN